MNRTKEKIVLFVACHVLDCYNIALTITQLKNEAKFFKQLKGNALFLFLVVRKGPEKMQNCNASLSLSAKRHCNKKSDKMSLSSWSYQKCLFVMENYTVHTSVVCGRLRLRSGQSLKTSTCECLPSDSFQRSQWKKKFNRKKWQQFSDGLINFSISPPQWNFHSCYCILLKKPAISVGIFLFLLLVGLSLMGRNF